MARVLALDVGERRVGVAISDPTGLVARPLEALIHASQQEDFEAVARLVDEYAVERVIVGLPLKLDGTEGRQARWVRRYAEQLAPALSVPIEFWDERFSSAIADEILRGDRSHQPPKRRRRQRASGKLDSTAAAVFLQSYLDAQKK